MNEMKMKMAGMRMGRVVLHLMAWVKDGKAQWHLNGIVRELALVKVRA